MPIWGDLGSVMSGSIAIGSFKNDGFVKDPDTGRRFNDDDTKAARAKLVYYPTDRFTATLAFDYTHQDTDLTMGRPTAPLVRDRKSTRLNSSHVAISYAV